MKAKHSHSKKAKPTKTLNRLKFSKPILIIFTLIFASIGGYALYRSFAAGPGANWGTSASPAISAANVWVSPTGNDSTCTRSSAAVAPANPCATFQRAYNIASLGDTVGMESGSYASQTITDDSSKDASGVSSHVTFTPQTAGGVTVQTLNISGADHLTINGVAGGGFGQVTQACGYNVTNNSNDVTLSYVHFCTSYVQVVQNFTLQNSELGPCIWDANEHCTNNFIDQSTSNSNILWNNDTVHDFNTVSGSGEHGQCLFMLWAATIQNSRFYNCEVFDIFMQPLDGGSPSMNGMLIQNNWFAPPTEDSGGYGSTAIEWSHPNTYSNQTVRYNSFGAGASPFLNSGDGAVAGANFNIVGNVIAAGSCGTGITYSYNVFYGGSVCSGTGNTTTGPAPFVSNTADSSLDYHLSGSAGSTAADNLVPCGSAPYNLSFDIDGQSRPQDTNCDAGADERGGSGGTPAPTVNLSASPTSIPSGSSSTLTWSSSNATSCTASGAWSGSESTSGSQSTGNLSSSSTYNLSCSGVGGTANTSATITVTGSGGGGGSSITIGETRILGTVDQGNANLLLAQSATLSQAATIQSMSFYVVMASGNLRMGIYDSSGPGGGPGVLKAQTAEITPTTGWNTANVTTTTLLQPGTYWLAYLPSSNNLNFVNTNDSTSSSELYSYSYGPLPSTFSTGPSANSAHWSFYATLNTGSGGSSVPGDTNGDGHVNITDLSSFLSNYGGTASSCDFNGDGHVTILDMSILLSHYGS